MKPNDIKKGMRIQLYNGWYGTMLDNMRGNTRMARIEGNYTENGSVYVWDIATVFPDYNNNPNMFNNVECTPAQLKRKASIANGGW